MLIPGGGRGEIRQLEFSPRRVRAAIYGSAASTVVLIGLLLVGVARLSSSSDRDAIAAENVRLTQRLADVDARVAALEPLVGRVRAYDEKLRMLESRGALPGFGPLDPADQAARDAWIEGVVALPTGVGPTSLTVEARVAAVEDDLAALSGGLDSFEDLLARYDGLESVLPQQWPVDGVLTSPFGYRRSPFTRRWTMHTGLDLGAPYGAPIYATNDGLVSYVGWDAGHGNSVFVDHGDEVTTRYHHASQVLVSEGDLVAVGDILALVGSTGMSTGPHLHYELVIGGEKVDPLPYMP